MRITLLILFLFFSTSAWPMGQLSEEATNSPLIGKVAPDYPLPKTDGKTSSVSSSRQSKRAIMIFWATWCPNCYEELGTINDNFKSIEGNGIKILLMDVGETKEQVQNYFNQRQMKLVSFLDEDSFLSGMYHLIGVPTIIFIDEKGIVRNIAHQFPSDYENKFR